MAAQPPTCIDLKPAHEAAGLQRHQLVKLVEAGRPERHAGVQVAQELLLVYVSAHLARRGDAHEAWCLGIEVDGRGQPQPVAEQRMDALRGGWTGLHLHLATVEGAQKHQPMLGRL